MAFSHAAHADSSDRLPEKDTDAKLSIGLNAFYYGSAYDTDNETMVMPNVFFDNNRWYFVGLEGGRYLYEDDNDQLRIGIGYDGQSFDPDDAEGDLEHLDKRKASAVAGFSYRRLTKYGGVRAKVFTDVLDNHNGTGINLAYQNQFAYDKWTFFPEVGLQWRDENYNDYYYSVSSEEVERSGSDELETYDADSSINPYASVTASYRINDTWDIFANQHIEYLADEQYDSPMVDDRLEYMTRIGFNYTF